MHDQCTSYAVGILCRVWYTTFRLFIFDEKDAGSYNLRYSEASHRQRSVGQRHLRALIEWGERRIS
jgi:hypothetical protein